ncbi:MAG: arylesterase [Myxococcota bacterium]|nr:arylesterase [Myxococcota bacterium]
MSQRHPTLYLLLIAGLLCGACRDEGNQTASRSAPATQTPSGPVWYFVGDSLTAGFGVTPSDAWVSQLGELLKERGSPHVLRNAGVSGDTSAGVLRRLDWILSEKAHTVFLSIGANDGLRGLPVESLRENLRKIIARCRETGARVILAGMQMPPNYGPDYTRAFADVYGEVAQLEKVPLMPFLLTGVGGVKELNQGDGIHPNADGHAKIATHVLSFLDQEGLLND